MKQMIAVTCAVAAMAGVPAFAVDAIQTNGIPAVQQEKEFTVSKKFLILPIQNKGGQEGNLKFYVDGKLALSYGLALASSPTQTDWYAFFEIERYKGKKAKVVSSKATDAVFALVTQSDRIPGEETFYKEKLRPQFHFTAKTGWLNDPNGLIYYKGEYHLYYQHNPVSIKWGNMTWGHAVSTDLVHWKEQPKVLFPDSKGACFSGAVFIDNKNLLGLKTGKDDVLVAFYLRTGIGLCYACSNDRGYTMTDFQGNPVLAHAGDRIDTPRPFWYEPTRRWVAPTYDFFNDATGKHFRCVGFYSSDNLTNWTFESRVVQPDGKLDELCGCVDFFQLPVDGDSKNKKWVMIMIDGSYIVGTFDGHTFYTLAGKPADTTDRISSLVYPGSYYATMTWEHAPHDRRVQMTWMSQGPHGPGMPFNKQMTLPSELTLHSTADGLRLRMNPIKELETLRAKTREWKNMVLKPGENPLAELKGDCIDLEIEFAPSAGTETVIDLRGLKTVYDAKTQTLTSCGRSAKLEPVDGLIRLRILLDRTSIEVYGNDGRVYIPHVVLPAETNLTLSVTAGRGEVKANYLRVHEMQSSWE